MRFAVPQKILFLFAWLSVLLVIALYAGLMPLARWQGDEYGYGVMLREQGLAGVLGRITSWSPRPVGELVSASYLWLADGHGTPLVAAFLFVVWGSALALLWWVGKVTHQEKAGFVACVLLAVSLLLCGQAEMFYWPMGAASYVPCWAALASASLVHRADATRHRWLMVFLLVVAAWSQEAGALTVLLYTGACVILYGVRRSHYGRAMCLPFLAAMFVVLTNITHRLGTKTEIFDPSSGLGGRWVPSLLKGGRSLLIESLHIPGLPFVASLVVIALLLVFAMGQKRLFPRNRACWLWSGALLGGAYSTLVLGYYEFGTLCCTRHHNLREATYFLVLVTLGGAVAASFERRAVAYGALVAALACLLAYRLPDIRADWQMRQQIIADRADTWQSGHAPGSAMTLYMPPTGHITNSDCLMTGEFDLKTAPWWVEGILHYFHKQHLTLVWR
ncbi:hypothetical protein [Acetobacter senegalensis]|uniref:hypothetical protein n=1 Tax=Acetobacter senegalensis TaxID=446692 RepID=UPI00128CFAD0|nr:hypothetical protein [Acetobacter senegalensis]MPQ74168.1 hypothetical protein [Acetobacter senegalensis]